MQMSSSIRSFSRIVLGVTATSTILFSPPQVLADPLSSEQVLRIEFTTSPPFSIVPDVMMVHLGIVDVFPAHTSRQAELWDCSDLLGTAVTTSFGGHVGLLSLNPANSFKTAGSLWTFDNPGVADFTSIHNGSIKGRVYYTIQTGAMDIPLSSVNLSLLKATSGSGGSGSSPAPAISNVQIVHKQLAPTPGTAGTNNTFKVTGAVPNHKIVFAYGFSCGNTVVPTCSVVVDIKNPKILGSTAANGLGEATVVKFVPAAAAGRTVLFQAVDQQDCAVSNMVKHTF